MNPVGSSPRFVYPFVGLLVAVSTFPFAWMVLSAGLLISGVNLYIAQHIRLGAGFILLSILVFLWGMRKA